MGLESRALCLQVLQLHVLSASGRFKQEREILLMLNLMKCYLKLVKKRFFLKVLNKNCPKTMLTLQMKLTQVLKCCKPAQQDKNKDREELLYKERVTSKLKMTWV